MQLSTYIPASTSSYIIAYQRERDTHRHRHSHAHTPTHTFTHSHTNLRLILTSVCAHMCATPAIPNYSPCLSSLCPSALKKKKERKNYSNCCLLLGKCIMNSFDFSLVEEQDPSVGLCPFFANHPCPQSRSKIVARGKPKKKP